MLAISTTSLVIACSSQAFVRVTEENLGEGACRKILCAKSVLGPLVLEALVQISTPGTSNSAYHASRQLR
jgi:hypothetical protein